MRGKTFLIVGSFLIGGCAIPRAEQTATERFHFDIAGRSRLEVRLDEGSINVIGTSSKELSIVVTKKARAHSEEGALALLDELDVDARQQGDRVQIEVRLRTGSRPERRGISVHSSFVRSDVEVRVPRETDLMLITEDGRIEVENVAGNVETETNDGGLRLREIEGAVRSRTSDGSIVGIDLTGDVDVSTGDGRIELAGNFGRLTAITSDGSIKVRCTMDCDSPEDWMIRSSDGSITLTLPSDFSAELEASTGDGRIVNELPITKSIESKTRIKGTMGRGGKLVLLRTSDGRITIRSK